MFFVCTFVQVFNVPGRCFPVDVIHSQDDHMQDYASAAIDTALQLHLNQPEGQWGTGLLAQGLLAAGQYCTSLFIACGNGLHSV